MQFQLPPPGPELDLSKGTRLGASESIDNPMETIGNPCVSCSPVVLATLHICLAKEGNVEL